MAPDRAMVVSASMGAMNSVLSKLTKLSEEENKAGLSKGTWKKVVFLRDELKSMQGLLEKLADREDHDALVKGWMRQVREMTYDLEDCIDLFGQSASPLGLHNSLNQMIKRLRRRLWDPFASKIEEMKQRVVEASERRSRYKLDDAATSSLPTVHVDPRVTSLYVRKDELIGIERPRDELIKILEDWQQLQLQVVAIVGFGGMGKTTLAMTVYEMLQLQFDCGAFVTVSQRPDITRLLRDMFYQVGHAQGYSVLTEAFDLHQLIDALREFFSRKRYLIVIDDLWSTEGWNVLRFAFPENGLGSKVLVTTRMLDVARSCCSYQTRSIYQMQPLSESESRSLFLRRAFDSEQEKNCPPEVFVEASKIVLKKCGGLPLAIIAVASMLATRSNVVPALGQITDSIGSSEFFSYPALQDMFHILDVSYVSLPIPLRTCLLYLSMFPEDYVIERKRLVRRWMAEGFISGNLEEVGESYLNELTKRVLIQPVDIQCDGRVNTCRVHDMVLELILSRSLEENFVISGSHRSALGLQDKVRRLSIHCNSGWDTFTQSETTTSHIRSLTVIGSNGQMPPLANFCVLRVLDLENYGEVESNYFESIGKLYLLKYLRLQTPSVIQLPEGMGKLENLETLDLAGAPKSKLPKSIIQLNKLVYFLVKNVKLPVGFGNMPSLKEVSCVDIESSNCRSSLKELEKLTILTTLGLTLCISGEDTDINDMLVSFLRKLIKSNIQFLYIECDDGCCSLDFLLNFPSDPCYHLREFQIKSNYFFNAVPKWIPSVISLTLLRINIETDPEEALHILRGLKSLEALILEVKSTATEQGLLIRREGFICLKQFDLTCWHSLGMLKFEEGAMINLQKLRVVFSTNGQFLANGFPFSIQHFTSLQHLVVEVKCDNVRAREVKAAADTIRAMVGNHPNRPRLELKTHAEEQTVPDERGIPVHGEEEDKNVEQGAVVEAKSTPATES